MVWQAAQVTTTALTTHFGRLEGLELPESIACNPRALRAGYLEAVGKFLADVRTRSASARCDYSLIRTGEPVDGALVKFLSRRASMAV